VFSAVNRLLGRFELWLFGVTDRGDRRRTPDVWVANVPTIPAGERPHRQEPCFKTAFPPARTPLPWLDLPPTCLLTDRVLAAEAAANKTVGLPPESQDVARDRFEPSVRRPARRPPLIASSAPPRRKSVTTAAKKLRRGSWRHRSSAAAGGRSQRLLPQKTAAPSAVVQLALVRASLQQLRLVA
jgi:hypothetical protein